MLPKLSTLLVSVRSQLSRKIALWVFASFMLIEGIVLIPSIVRYEQKLVAQTRDVSSAKLDWILETYPQSSAQELLERVQALQAKPMIRGILGGRLYRLRDGQELGRFGEAPTLSFQQIQQGQTHDRWFKFQQRYDATWEITNLPESYVLVIRHDAALIQSELISYTLRIFGVVCLIAGVITGVTLLVVEVIVIVPILQLRDRLVATAEALSQPQLETKSYLLSNIQQDELGEVMAVFNQSFLRTYEEMSRRKAAEAIAQEEQQKAERLLLNILPALIAEELKQGERSIADGFADVTVLFADIVGFTSLSARITPHELVDLLNQIFSAFDDLSDKHGLEKIKTIGDNYMVAGGLPIPRKDHAVAIANMALEMQHVIAQIFSPELGRLSLRIGINSGPVVAGVIGTKKFIYDLWGDTVNIASRMESSSLPGRIQVTQSAYEQLKDTYVLEERGVITVKGRGEMKTYWLKERKAVPITSTV